jgi:DNA-binding XRE family transcriptional regulator
MEQDWTTVVLKKKVKPSKPLSVTNPEVLRLRAIENDEPVKKRELTRESRQALTSGRIAKNMTQEQVDHVCGFPKHTIRDIESGKLVPSGPQMAIIQKYTGIVLRIAH